MSGERRSDRIRNALNKIKKTEPEERQKARNFVMQVNLDQLEEQMIDALTHGIYATATVDAIIVAYNLIIDKCNGMRGLKTYLQGKRDTFIELTAKPSRKIRDIHKHYTEWFDNDDEQPIDSLGKSFNSDKSTLWTKIRALNSVIPEHQNRIKKYLQITDKSKDAQDIILDFSKIEFKAQNITPKPDEDIDDLITRFLNVTQPNAAQQSSAGGKSFLKTKAQGRTLSLKQTKKPKPAPKAPPKSKPSPKAPKKK